MTDRELIELAAKAAGYGVPWYIEGSDCPYVGEKYSGGPIGYRIFNPLKDDTDRYRLAKKLNMRIDFDLCFVETEHVRIDWPEDEPDDARAITRAAAEIGKAM